MSQPTSPSNVTPEITPASPTEGQSASTPADGTILAGGTALEGQPASTPASVPANAPASPTPWDPTSLTPEQLEAVAKVLKRKVKVDGQELEVGLEDLERDYQLKEASMKRFQESATLKKQLQEIIQVLRERPADALAHELIGHDPRKVAEDILAQHLQRELMSPEEREVLTLKQERDALLARIREEEATQAAAKQQAEQAARSAAIEADIQAALKDARIPVSDAMLENMREVMQVAAQEAAKAGQPPFTAKDLVDVAKGRFRAQLAKFFGDASGDVLAEFLGEQGLARVRQYDLGRLKKGPAVVPPDQQPPKKDTKDRPRGASTRDILATLRGQK